MICSLIILQIPQTYHVKFELYSCGFSLHNLEQTSHLRPDHTLSRIFHAPMRSVAFVVVEILILMIISVV